MNNEKDVRINDGKDIGINNGIVKMKELIKVMFCWIDRKLSNNSKKNKYLLEKDIADFIWLKNNK